MPDLTPQLLPRLENHQLSGLKLPAEFIAPKYQDQSILNIPDSICHWLGIPGIGEGALIPEILDPLGNGIRRVILILMDALALHRLQRWMEDGTALVWRSLTADGLLAPITSISPSTTSAALTTLWTGRSPASHGILGYEVWLKEYGMVANMILHAPMTFRGDVGTLSKAGFDPQKFLPLPTLGPHLRQQAITPYAFQHRSIAHSGLSQMFQQEVDIYGFHSVADLWVSLRQMIESKPNERQYIWTYWGEYDGLSHAHGPDDERSAAEFAHFSAAFEQFFLKRLSPAARKDTLVILTADHGQIHTPLVANNSLKHHPAFNQHLHITPTGENRMSYLYLRPGSETSVRDYLQANWSPGFTILTREKALSVGLFGPGAQHPGLNDRIGDLIAFAHEDAYLWWDKKDDFMLGRHGGLHRQEMLVPFLTARLG
jgi:predicted AlkP superfamily pyrophosphatase or phosphodiesterase